MKKYILPLIAIVFFVNFAFALNSNLATQKLYNNYTLIFTADNATQCNFTYIQYPTQNVSAFYNFPMTQMGQTFTILINGNNFTQTGTTCLFYTCYDPIAIPNTASGNTCLNVTPNGTSISPVQISVYILFLIVCLTLTYFSIRAIQKSPFSEDELKDSQRYQQKKQSKMKFYFSLLKQKFWIIGVFGLYLSIFLFTAILNNLVMNLGIIELSQILSYINFILAWGTIPFILFWFAYILIYLYKGTENVVKYEYGSLMERQR